MDTRNSKEEREGNNEEKRRTLTSKGKKGKWKTRKRQEKIGTKYEGGKLITKWGQNHQGIIG